MVRRTSLALALALGIAPFSVNALGLGEIKLNSALNQYLDADIKLLSVNTDSLPDLRVSLASPEAFKRAGIERPFILSKLKFKPVARPDGRIVVHVSSRDPIREPFLNFLVEVNWPKGKMVREYTLLLDPPVTLDRRPAPVAAPRATVTAPPVTAPRPATDRSVVSGTDVAWAASEPAAAADEYGPTKRNDTLWGIAEQVRHDGASMQQTMIALFRANPQAFINENINNLKIGQIIRVPKRDEVMALSRREAQQVYSEHLNAWQADRAPTPAIETEKPAMARPEEAEAPAAEEPAEPELKIATPRPEGEGEAGPGEGAEPAQALEELQQELILAQEEKASALQEGIELQSRVTDLESQLEDLERLLTLKSEQLARLQAAAQATGEEAPAMAEAETAMAEAEPAMAEAAAQDEGETLEIADTAEEMQPAPEAAPVVEEVLEVKPEAETAAVQPAEPKLTAKPKKEREKGFIEKVMSDPTMLGIAIAVVVVMLSLVWVLISRRRSSAADFQESILVSTIDDTDSEQLVDEGSETEKHPMDESSFLSDFSPSDIDALQDETGEVDPLAETDVYIAYGRYQQAEELITQAIEKDPERIELRHKLFEILSAVKNKDKFVATAEECVEQGIDSRDTEAWGKVVAMGAQLAPEHELFAGYEGEMAGEGDLDLDDITNELDIADDSHFEGASEMEEELSELELDFDLEEETEEQEKSEKEALDELDESTFDLEVDTQPSSMVDTDEEASEIASGFDFDLETPVAEGEAEEGELNIEDTLEHAELDELDLSDLEETGAAGETPEDEDVLSFSEDELSELEGLELESVETADEEGETLSLDDLDEGLEMEQDEVPAETAGATDEVSTKLDLARAYIDMGDNEGAQDILQEVMSEGDDGQKQEAQQMLDQIS
ncbi:MAG: FimV/HubP family polar landmark protein [Sedimenticola sp.]